MISSFLERQRISLFLRSASLWGKGGSKELQPISQKGNKGVGYQRKVLRSHFAWEFGWLSPVYTTPALCLQDEGKPKPSTVKCSSSPSPVYQSLIFGTSCALATVEWPSVYSLFCNSHHSNGKIWRSVVKLRQENRQPSAIHLPCHWFSSKCRL